MPELTARERLAAQYEHVIELLVSGVHLATIPVSGDA
jgi:hypothetical protein